MTEERIKEWLETHEPTVDDTMQLLAEAREEGRVEGIEEIEMSLLGYIIGTGPLDAKVVHLTAERLEEKGDENLQGETQTNREKIGNTVPCTDVFATRLPTDALHVRAVLAEKEKP